MYFSKEQIITYIYDIENYENTGMFLWDFFPNDLDEIFDELKKIYKHIPTKDLFEIAKYYDNELKILNSMRNIWKDFSLLKTLRIVRFYIFFTSFVYRNFILTEENQLTLFNELEAKESQIKQSYENWYLRKKEDVKEYSLIPEYQTGIKLKIVTQEFFDSLDLLACDVLLSYKNDQEITKSKQWKYNETRKIWEDNY